MLVMPGLVPGIYVLASPKSRKTWMAGTSPALTEDDCYFACLTASAGLLPPSSPVSIKIVSSAFCGPK